MAHQLDFSNGRWSCFTAGKAPWHKLGVNVADCQTSADAMRMANLEWSIMQRPVDVRWHDGSHAEAAGWFANCRSDTGAALGIVTGAYTPLQNADAFAFMDDLVGEKLAMFETAGALRGGRRVWMMAKLPRTLHVTEQDTVEPYLLLTNSHDGTASVEIMLTTVRVVCANTLRLALSMRGQKSMSMQHRSGLSARVAEARRALSLAIASADRFEQQAQAMAARKMTTSEMAEYFASVVDKASAKQQKKLLDRFAHNLTRRTNTLDGIERSLWAAYNSVSEYADHQAVVRGRGVGMDEKRLSSIWFGAAHDMKTRAFETALALAS